LDEKAARDALRATLPLLTRISDLPWLEVDRNNLTLNPDLVWSDVQSFIKTLIQLRTHIHRDGVLCMECVTAMENAVKLYKGDFLAGFSLSDSVEFDNWQSAKREWLNQEYTQMLRRLAEHYSGSNLDAAMVFARRWLEVDPLNEPAHRLLMRLYAPNDQRWQRWQRDHFSGIDTEADLPVDGADRCILADLGVDFGVQSLGEFGSVDCRERLGLKFRYCGRIRRKLLLDRREPERLHACQRANTDTKCEENFQDHVHGACHTLWGCADVKVRILRMRQAIIRDAWGGLNDLKTIRAGTARLWLWRNSMGSSIVMMW
jgi:hypothetical protein